MCLVTGKYHLSKIPGQQLKLQSEKCLFLLLSLLCNLSQVLDESKLQEVDSLWKEFQTPEKANKM